MTEDGVAQEVVAFDAVHRPAPGIASAGAPAPAAPAMAPRSSSNREPVSRLGSHFVIVFDELHLDPAEAARARAAIADFLATGVSDGDRVALVGTAQGTRWTARLPEGKEALRQALDRLQPGLVGETVRDRMSDWEAMRIDRDRDPLVTDVVMRRYLDTGEIDQDTASPGNRVLPQADEVDELARRRAVPRRLCLRPRRRPQRAGPRRRGALARGSRRRAGAEVDRLRLGRDDPGPEARHLPRDRQRGARA